MTTKVRDILTTFKQLGFKDIVGILYNGEDTKVFKCVKKGRSWKYVGKGIP